MYGHTQHRVVLGDGHTGTQLTGVQHCGRLVGDVRDVASVRLARGRRLRLPHVQRRGGVHLFEKVMGQVVAVDLDADDGVKRALRHIAHEHQRNAIAPLAVFGANDHGEWSRNLDERATDADTQERGESSSTAKLNVRHSTPSAMRSSRWNSGMSAKPGQMRRNHSVMAGRTGVSGTRKVTRLAAAADTTRTIGRSHADWVTAFLISRPRRIRAPGHRWYCRSL